MKIILAGILLMGIVAAVFAGCDFQGQKLKTGEKYSPSGECFQYTCNEDGSVGGLTCPAISAPPGCKHIPQDDSKPYPKCCESYDC